LKANITQLHEEIMTTETLLDEKKKELDKSSHDFKLVAVKYQEVNSKLVRTL